MRIQPTEFGAVIVTPEGEMPIRQIFGIGLNYAEHAKEQGSVLPERPVVFSKGIKSVIATGQPIIVPTICQDREQVDFEGELAIVIGRPARDVPRDRAASFILGYAAANDVSARWWQKQGSGGQFLRGKGFDTFCPLSSVTPVGSVPNPSDLRVITRLNGQVMQDGPTSDMIFDPLTLVAELSRGLTLVPGTVILTGTPSGVGMARKPPVFLKAGDTIEVEIPGVGNVSSPVKFE
jgi:2-keto-4-pentenoate hydratase/2-oxohepta-3-ene-1,7-dioic acid hydratase in catechol pathway